MTMTQDACCLSVLDQMVPRTPKVDRVRRAAFAALRCSATPSMSALAATTGLDLSVISAVVAQLVSAGIATIEGIPLATRSLSAQRG